MTLRYDALNRLREVVGANGELVTHDYDANTRRIKTTAVNVGGQPAYEEYYYDGWTIIEETAGGSTTLLRRTIGAHGTDEPLKLDNRSSVWGVQGEYYYQRTTAGTICAVSDASGAIAERYTYDGYGTVQFETPGNVVKPVATSDHGNPQLHHGLRFDAYVLPVSYARWRYYSGAIGRFLQRDAIGTWGDEDSHGNAYAFAWSGPLDFIDNLGLEPGKRYDSIHQAAYHAANDAWPITMSTGKEVGGWIYTTPDGGFSYTKPFLGTKNSVKTPVRKTKSGRKTLVDPAAQGHEWFNDYHPVVGSYHTHPWDSGKGFSDTDAEADKEDDVVGYLIESVEHRQDPQTGEWLPWGGGPYPGRLRVRDRNEPKDRLEGLILAENIRDDVRDSIPKMPLWIEDPLWFDRLFWRLCNGY